MRSWQGSRTFIADYSQNASIPMFGQSQPGDTYYFSPMTINIFGIVDCSIRGGTLAAHVYTEGDGKKGGDNVASLLLKELKIKGLMDPNQTNKELTIIMDNCPGQNKNNMVLRLSLYLVEAGFFNTVNFLFYVVGHTKNAADRWFNQLKKTYRRSDIYTMDQLILTFKTSKNIEVRKVQDFKKVNVFLNMFYKPFESGTILKNHIFTVDAIAPTTVKMKTDNIQGTPECFSDLKKGTGSMDDRRASLKSYVLQVIQPPGLPDIKKVELYTKWRPLLPAAFVDLTCPYPGDEVMARIKNLYCRL